MDSWIRQSYASFQPFTDVIRPYSTASTVVYAEIRSFYAVNTTVYFSCFRPFTARRDTTVIRRIPKSSNTARIRYRVRPFTTVSGWCNARPEYSSTTKKLNYLIDRDVDNKRISMISS